MYYIYDCVYSNSYNPLSEEGETIMGYISKYDTNFITFVNRKHRKSFEFFDDYILWLYYIHCKMNTNLYYKILEKDIWDFSDWQTGTPRDKEKKDDSWQKKVFDKYGLLKDDSKYVEYLKRNEWDKWKKN